MSSEDVSDEGAEGISSVSDEMPDEGMSRKSQEPEWREVSPSEWTDETVSDLAELTTREFEVKHDVKSPSGYEYYDSALDVFQIPRLPHDLVLKMQERIRGRSQAEHQAIVAELTHRQEVEPMSRGAFGDATKSAVEALRVLKEPEEWSFEELHVARAGFFEAMERMREIELTDGRVASPGTRGGLDG
jgi:hypothetical protein